MAEESPPRAFVTGFPVRHSRSPLIHGHWLATAGIAGSYEKLAVAPEDFGSFVASLKDRSAAYAGGNVTIPHKEAIFDLADDIDETARLIGAANTIWFENGRLCATNTDAYGFAANLDEQRAGWDTGTDAVVLGAGGGSRAVIHALKQRGYRSIRIVNRTRERAVELSDRFGSGVTAHPMDELADVLSGADLFVNTTSLGMDGSPAPAIDFTSMSPGALVTDIVYVPLVTPFIAMAREQGLATADGLGMLLHQAVPGFEKWFGVRPVVTAELRRMIIADMEAST